MNSATNKDTVFFDSGLFHDVQMAAIFADSKTFADAIPRQSYQCAIDAYAQQKSLSSFNISRFVDEYFVLPVTPKEPEVAKYQRVQEYIDSLWPELCRPADEGSQGSLLNLGKPYLVPGGRFREIYYWDSYFTSLGLEHAGRHDLISNMIDNFISLQSTVGLIPNGNRSYYHSRSQPPVLALMVDMVLGNSKQWPDTVIKPYLTALQKEHDFWMSGEQKLTSAPCCKRVVKLPCGARLNRFWDDVATPRPESHREDIEATEKLGAEARLAYFRNIRAACESGWDFSSRWLANNDDLHSIQTTELLPVDLNCLLYLTEIQISTLYSTLGDSDSGQQWQETAEQRKKAVMKYCWNEAEGLFMDYHLLHNQQTQTKSLATVLPLFCGMVTPEQAGRVAENLSKHFLVEGGLLTTLNTTRQQWDAPNGWAPLHWFAVKGLLRYQFRELSQTIMQRWVKTVEAYYAKHHTLMEKYNLVEVDQQAQGGEYEVQHGFGWTNGVTKAFYQMLKTHKDKQ